jgi:hypothetical protein
MRYSILHISASLEPEHCFVGTVEGGAGGELLIACGEPASAHYPSEADDVLVHLDVARRGVKLASRLANTQQLLILSIEALTALTAVLDFGRFDVHPFLLINHKRRVHSRDYVFVNSLEHRVIAHEQTRFQKFEPTGRIFDCEEWVLDSHKLEGAPDLLRSVELPCEYFASERFVDAVARLGLSNFAFVEVEHR